MGRGLIPLSVDELLWGHVRGLPSPARSWHLTLSLWKVGPEMVILLRAL